MKSKNTTTLGAIGAALGKGLIAGAAGTIAITVSQMIEMKITGRKPSNAPAEAVEKTLNIEPKPGNKETFSNEVHWVYGTAWGAIRGLLSLTGMNSAAATSTHFAAVWGAALAIQPGLKIGPGITEMEPKDIAVDIFHHAVYAAVTGAVYDAID